MCRSLHVFMVIRPQKNTAGNPAVHQKILCSLFIKIEFFTFFFEFFYIFVIDIFRCDHVDHGAYIIDLNNMEVFRLASSEEMASYKYLIRVDQVRALTP